MNANGQEKHFFGEVKDLLREGVENLDNQTRERLGYVRIRVLRSARKSVLRADLKFPRAERSPGKIFHSRNADGKRRMENQRG